MTQTWTYPTAFSAWGEEEDEAFARVRKSGRYTSGPEVEAFEEEFSRYHGLRHGVMTNSGSSANLVAVASLVQAGKLASGDLVIVPAIAWATTYAPLAQYGLDLLVCDVDDTWNAAQYLLEGPYDKAKLVVGCSVLGNPARMDVWSKYPWLVLEDNCESLGATIEGKLTGTFGHLNTFSFFHSHQLSAIEGGMILTDDPELARLCRLLRNHGNAGFLTPNPTFAQSYDFRLMGYNLRGLELHAAIGRAQLRKLETFKFQRLKNQAYFETLVRSDGLPVTPQAKTKADSTSRSPFGLSFEVESAAMRERLVQALRQAGIDCRLPTGGSFLRHTYAGRWAKAQRTPRADQVHERGLFCGNAPFDISDKIDQLVKVMKATL